VNRGVNRERAQAWLDRYVAAWKSYDAAEIGALFSESAEYRYHPWDEPVRGRTAIVADWVEPEGDASGRDEPGTYDAEYRPWAIDADHVVAIGTSTYFADATRSTVRRVFSNVFLMDFDPDGRCRSFTELFIEHPQGVTGS